MKIQVDQGLSEQFDKTRPRWSWEFGNQNKSIAKAFRWQNPMLALKAFAAEQAQ